MPVASVAIFQSRFIRAWSSIIGLLRWRGPFVIAALAVTECLRPLLECQVWYIFDDATWKIGEHEAVRYDSYVVPSCRGRRIHGLLNFGANSLARSRGIRRALGSISILNRPSLRLAQPINEPWRRPSCWSVCADGRGH
jgi:hypothetical protein